MRQNKARRPFLERTPISNEGGFLQDLGQVPLNISMAVYNFSHSTVYCIVKFTAMALHRFFPLVFM
jgi:hypothetical protein